MSAKKRPKNTDELVDLILKHDPNASVKVITDIISEWGDLFDDHRFGDMQSARDRKAEPINRVGR
jgi:hypothetical protein